MEINADNRPQEAPIRHYNGPSLSEVAPIIPGAEGGQGRGRSIFLRHCGTLNKNCNKVYDTVSVSHSLYDTLSYVVILTNVIVQTSRWEDE